MQNQGPRPDEAVLSALSPTPRLRARTIFEVSMHMEAISAARSDFENSSHARPPRACRLQFAPLQLLDDTIEGKVHVRALQEVRADSNAMLSD